MTLTVHGAAAERPSITVEDLADWMLAGHPGRYVGTTPVTLWFQLVEGAAAPVGVTHLDVLVVASGSTRAEAALRIVLEAPIDDTEPGAPPDGAEPDAPLSAEQVVFLDSVPTYEARADAIVFPNGVTLAEYVRANRPDVGTLTTGEVRAESLDALKDFSPQKQKDHIICAMMLRALELTAPRTLPAGSGPYEPEQTRIGYVCDGKQYIERSSAVTVDGRVAGCAVCGCTAWIAPGS